MDIAELEEALDKQKKMCEQYGLPQGESIALVITSDKPARGYNIKTPFGIAEICNQQKVSGKFQIVFYAKRSKVEKYIKKAKSAND